MEAVEQLSSDSARCVEESASGAETLVGTEKRQNF